MAQALHEIMKFGLKGRGTKDDPYRKVGICRHFLGTFVFCILLDCKPLTPTKATITHLRCNPVLTGETTRVFKLGTCDKERLMNRTRGHPLCHTPRIRLLIALPAGTTKSQFRWAHGQSARPRCQRLARVPGFGSRLPSGCEMVVSSGLCTCFRQSFS